MQNTSTPPSIVEYYAEHERYKCGYCKIPNKCYSHGSTFIFIVLVCIEILYVKLLNYIKL